MFREGGEGFVITLRGLLVGGPERSGAGRTLKP